MGLSEKPLVSVVTVVLNNRECLERTIQSVIGQSYKNIEYIIIDGGSNDGTLDIIKKYEDSIRTWVSEPDGGIYDAMNKGVALAEGEFINFMNAGDTFYESYTLEKIFQNYSRDADMIYGDCKIVYSDRLSRVKKAGDIAKLWKGLLFSHQSLFAKGALLKEYKFDINLATSADFNFIFNMYSMGYKFHNTRLIISSVMPGGKSGKYWLQGATGWWQVARRHDNSMKLHLYYCLLISGLFFISIAKKLLPGPVIDSIRMFNEEARRLVHRTRFYR